MPKITQWLLVIFIGGNLLLGTALFITIKVHGINDQDASYALALVCYFLNLPSLCVMELLMHPFSSSSMYSIPSISSISSTITSLDFLTAFVYISNRQWALIALALGTGIHYAGKLIKRKRRGEIYRAL